MTTTTTPIRSADPEQYETVRASVPARPRSPRAAAWAWVLRTEQRVLDVLARLGIPVLRLSLAFVYVAFGALKIAGLSPVGELVASMVPFLPETQAVIAMGVFEVVAGLLIAFGLFVPWVAAAQVVHLLGTFAVFLVYPALAYSDGNPLALTLTGEFIAKNVVLIAGLFVVAAFSRTRPSAR
ncbi:MAG TPA: DoxX family protein [Protaetiibacter sp.]|nr:DoxX family protein [Protaetiibacter sp.]